MTKPKDPQQDNRPNDADHKRHRPLLSYAPLAIIVVLVVVFFLQLGKDKETINSPLLNNRLPAFTATPIDNLPASMPSINGFTNQLSSGQVSILNVWASWCVPCRAEHPLITAIGLIDNVPIYGLNYKDKPQNAVDFLIELGNPFYAVGADADGRIGIKLGVYGIPETYIIDHNGVIVHKHVGPLTETSLDETFRPALDKAKAEALNSKAATN